MLRLVAFGLIVFAAAADAEDFNWRNRSNQIQMNTVFEGAAKSCEAMFGFTSVSVTDRATMPDKIDAYLLLRDNPDATVEEWGLQIVGPIHAMGSKKSTASTESDDRKAASAAVAAAKDPSVYAEAEQRYLEGAMAPFRRALDACTAGANDPFLGKYYLTGSGSSADVEKSMKDYFSELVAGLKTKISKPRSKPR